MPEPAVLAGAPSPQNNRCRCVSLRASPSPYPNNPHFTLWPTGSSNKQAMDKTTNMLKCNFSSGDGHMVRKINRFLDVLCNQCKIRGQLSPLLFTRFLFMDFI